MYIIAVSCRVGIHKVVPDSLQLAAHAKHLLIGIVVVFISWVPVLDAAFAAITPTGDVSPSYTGSDPWDLSGISLRVGNVGVGSLLIDDASIVNNNAGFLGYEDNSNGTVTVSGPDSAWHNNSSLSVGYNGEGTLLIEAAGSVSSTYGYIAERHGSTGTVTVTGAGSKWDTIYGFQVGFQGPGTLNLFDGGTVNARSGEIRNGTVNISGVGSSWNTTELLNVDDDELSFLNILSGGLASSPKGIARGVVNVRDAGSLWQVTTELYISGELNIENGGNVQSVYSSISAYESLSTGTVAVSGIGSLWDITDELYVGDTHNGSLHISDGGTVNVDKDTLVGWYMPANGSIVFDNGTLTGGGLLAAVDALQGIGTINTSGLVSDVNLVFDATHGLQQQLVLNNEPGQNITIHLDASGSQGLGSMGAAYRGTGSLAIADGLSVSSRNGYLGYHTDANGSASVSGSSSNWDNSGDLSVGHHGHGTLEITNGGLVNDMDGYVGRNYGSSGGATVDGVGSEWNNTGDLFIAYEGAGTLNVLNGGTVRSTEGYLNYNSLGAETATVVIDGTGSKWINSGNLIVGYGKPGRLDIQNGGSVSTSWGIVGRSQQFTFDTISTVTVIGNGSIWNNADALVIGQRTSGQLTIGNHGTVNALDGYIGRSAGGKGTVSISNSGSSLNITQILYVGYEGHGTLDVTNGGAVNTGTAYLGYETGITGTVTVDGAGSAWSNTGELHVGYRRSGSLYIQNGGIVNNHAAFIGTFYGNGTANVTGTGSVWNNTGALTVAGYYSTGLLNVSDGGEVRSASGNVGFDVNSMGTVNVDGEGSLWINNAGLTVGMKGQGTLNIDDGGVVQNTYAYLGGELRSRGIVTVKGDGSAWHNSGLLRVGIGGAGTLTIDDGGLVNVGLGMPLAASTGSVATVNLSGGVLNMNGSSIVKGSGAASFNFTGGVLVNAGTINLQQPFVQAGGTFAPGGSIGLTNIVGDYELSAGVIEIELGGVGNPHDMLTATGDIGLSILGTTLDLRALGSMAAGTYTVLESTGGTITGMFESVSLFNLFGVNVDVQNTGTAITISLDSDLVFADPNLDGFVGIADLNIVLSNWNQSVTAGDILSGDLNGDGFVGIVDLTSVLGNWNAGTPPTGTEAFSQVPEPGPGTILVILTSAVVANHRFSRNRDDQL